jgi:hypothetical protein
VVPSKKTANISPYNSLDEYMQAQGCSSDAAAYDTKEILDGVTHDLVWQCIKHQVIGKRSKESGVVLSSIVSCQHSCSRCFLQIFHAKILMRCRLEATHEAIEGLLQMDPGALPFFGWMTFLPKY